MSDLSALGVDAATNLKLSMSCSAGTGLLFGDAGAGL